MLHDGPSELQNIFAVHQIQFVGVYASFVASAQERFEQAVVKRVSALLALLDGRLGAISEARNFFRQLLIPQLPAENLGQALRDLTAAASVLSFHRDDSDHSDSK